MRLNQKILIVGLVMVSMTFSSCLETHVTNTVMTNGSVLRTVVFKSDNIEDFDFSVYPVPVDETWRKIISFEMGKSETNNDSIDSVGDTTWIYTYEKNFNSVDEINKLYDAGFDSYGHTSRRAEFEKKFRWFFSNVIFREILDAMIVGVAPESYFSREEYEVFLMEDTARLQYVNHPDSVQRIKFVEHVISKTDDWRMTCLAEDFVHRLAKYVDESVTVITSDQVKAKHDDIVDMVGSESDLYEITALVFDENPEVIFGEGILTFFNETELFYERIFDVENIGYTMGFVMPGKLTDANGSIIDKNLVQWHVSSEKFFATPFVMLAESRIVNVWAWIISAVFVVFVLVGIFNNKKAAR